MTMKTKTKTEFIPRTPVVTVLGHVDHGKTTLLDTIRKTRVAAKEHGGITQHIGAYQIDINPTNKKVGYKKITFIDTPGHEAFAKMRIRGAQVADLAILVVAGNDGIKPQTVESINHIKAANIPCIVAINKIDLPDINIENIKKQLTKSGLKLEEYGGETPIVPISAMNNKGIDKLIEMILLLSEFNQIQDKNPDRLQAVVIESYISKHLGPVATIILQSGKLKTGQDVICDNQKFRIRAIYDWNNNTLQEIYAGDPGLILGWKYLSKVGSSLYDANQVAITLPQPNKITKIEETIPLSIPPEKSITEEKIKLLLKADTTGTLEAITTGLKHNLEIILSQVGAISESDILLARTTKALVIGFGLKIPENVLKLAQTEKVIIKNYSIIYKLFEEIEEVVDAVKKGNLIDILGEAKVIALFPYDDETVAGVKVISGRIARGDQIKIMRQDNEIGRTRVKSLKHFKEEVNRAEQGDEAGVLFAKKLDILTSDSIIAIG